MIDETAKYIPGQVRLAGSEPPVTAQHIVADISVGDWLEAEKSLKFVQPPESVTVSQYAAVRHFRNNAAGHQKARRILEGLVERGRAVKLQTKPACYRLRSAESMEEKAKRIL